VTGEAGTDADQPTDADDPADADEAATQGASRAPTPAPAPVPRRPRLSLDDPLTGRAAEDRPEGWGERTESDSDQLAHYRAQRPPHHGQ
jgi:hypothetical protein